MPKPAVFLLLNFELAIILTTCEIFLIFVVWYVLYCMKKVFILQYVQVLETLKKGKQVSILI